MGFTNVALKDKILEMYPDIERFRLAVGHDFNKGGNAYIVKLKKGAKALATLLEKKDADNCMDGIKCVCLGVKIGQFIKNFEML